MNIYIAYYRVSTQKQGLSGLGLSAQQKMVADFCKSGTLLAEFTDVESGKNSNRPELLKAITLSKAKGALLVIAKLDRLSRNVFFISSLLESGVAFKALDIPVADHFTVHLFAALAEKERKMISERTKAALAAKKERGYKLGSPYLTLTDEIRKKGTAKLMENARSDEHWVRALTVIRLLRQNGSTYRAIAQELNQAGFKTRYGKAFHPMAVKRLYERELQKASPNLT
ncbi:recombinase family protein [Rhodocytophaga aerolata]|uniref:Recombinase family protein n=1 Tax=Rhodocytophaga aerolata TaxID=455078 RepID=A0ABT8RG33_9BACT|nr:recombinase family protein [Rhodocytophaga aerolata]MDO1451071.1 recombinase family protein [Rhodocytophaga aerolata]